MARYIDADSTIKAIRDKFNIYFEVPCDSDDRRVQEIIGKVKKVIQEQPTADVVPKSELERLEKEVDRLSQVVLYHDAFKADEIRDAKTEVAKEIFEEIEKIYEEYGFFNSYRIAELKKKYTEEKV